LESEQHNEDKWNVKSADDTKQGNCKHESILMRSAKISLQLFTSDEPTVTIVIV
jgi:hypothetical protein